MGTTEVLALIALSISAVAVGISIWQALVARKATKHAADSAAAAQVSAAAALEANRLSSISVETAKNQDLRETARASRELTGWAIERSALHTDYKITNFGHEFAVLHSLEGSTNPQLYDAPMIMNRHDSTEFHIEESNAAPDRFIVVVWTDRSNSWSRHTVPLP